MRALRASAPGDRRCAAAIGTRRGGGQGAPAPRLATFERTSRAGPAGSTCFRTGAESRVSNFLLWQIAYSEITYALGDVADAGRTTLAGTRGQQRERRFGLTGRTRGGEEEVDRRSASVDDEARAVGRQTRRRARRPDRHRVTALAPAWPWPGRRRRQVVASAAGAGVAWPAAPCRLVASDPAQDDAERLDALVELAATSRTELCPARGRRGPRPTLAAVRRGGDVALARSVVRRSL